MERALVSILIPFKNTAEFLPECLQSILDQHYKDWEVLAVDDHSKDNSREIVNAYALKNPGIKVFDNEGSGIIPALRTAYKRSEGNYITRMDSDDIMKPHKLSTLVSLLNKNGKGSLAVGKVQYFSERGISNGYKRYEDWLNKLTLHGTNFSERYKECVIPSPCWMLHREDLDSCGAFDHGRYPEDYDLAFRMYQGGLQCLACDEVLHLWRDYDTRTSRTSIHYAQNYFLDIKLFYFLKLDWDSERPIVVWGAGNKGKTIAKALLEKKIPFHWVCDNPNKIGRKIYGKTMMSYTAVHSLQDPQSIITVANEDAQRLITSFFHSLEKKSMDDYFFFC